MNRHSLFFYIGVFYLFLVCVINWLFYTQVDLYKKDMISKALENANDVKRFYVDRYIKDRRGKLPPPVHNPREPFSNNQKPPFEFQKGKKPPFSKPPFPQRDIKNEDKQVLLKLFSLEILERNDTIAQDNGTLLFKKPDIGVFEYKEWIYIYDYGPDGKIGNTFRYKNKSHIKQVVFTAIFVNMTILIFVILVIQKILPIRKLKKSIVRFSKGDLNARSGIKGKDEIAEVSKEFDNAIGKIQSLQNSRNLFLRNIMHELKTPIAKGKMITELMSDKKNSDRLKTILDRFEYLLNEFSKIEKVTSNELILEMKEYKNIDILDSALDILMIDSDALNVKVSKVKKIKVDFELFSIALKNLIDNAIKYGSGKPTILLDDQKISIFSKGEKIENLDFEKVFKRSFEDSQKGLGLGLYITYNIIKKHGLHLGYTHENGENIFTVFV